MRKARRYRMPDRQHLRVRSIEQVVEIEGFFALDSDHQVGAAQSRLFLVDRSEKPFRYQPYLLESKMSIAEYVVRVNHLEHAFRQAIEHRGKPYVIDQNGIEIPTFMELRSIFTQTGVVPVVNSVKLTQSSFRVGQVAWQRVEVIPTTGHFFALLRFQAFEGLVEKMDNVAQRLQLTTDGENASRVALILRMACNRGDDQNSHNRSPRA